MKKNLGFTLVELLVVIAIIAILSTVGAVAFRGVTSNARDSARKADVEAIAKAYEVKANGGSYSGVADADFASGKKPKDPVSSKGDYFSWLDSNGVGFKICASLDNNSNNTCNTPAANCYCQFSSQGSISPSSTADSSSTQSLGGLGGSSSLSCDPNGTLLSGLVGYWKMDEGAGTTVADFSGRGNNGTMYGGTLWLSSGNCKSGSCLKYPNNNTDFVMVPVNTNSLLKLENSDFTIVGWMYIPLSSCTYVSGTAYCGSGILGNYPHPGNYNDLSIGISDDNATLFLNHRNNNDQYQSFNYNFKTPTSYFDKWTYFAFVKNTNNSKLHLYLDGSLKSSFSITIPFTVRFDQPNNNNFYIGRTDWYHGVMNNVLLDDIRIYNRALSTEEVQALYGPSGSGCIPQ